MEQVQGSNFNKTGGLPRVTIFNVHEDDHFYKRFPIGIVGSLQILRSEGTIQKWIIHRKERDSLE